MLRTRFFSFFTILALLLSLSAGAAAAEVESGSVYCFSAGDFSQNGELTGICITSLPQGSLGSVMLGSRVLREGDILTAGQVAQMTFSPVATEQDQSAQISYLPIFEDHVAASATMTIGIRGKEDKAPVAEDQALETYKNLPGTGRLKASDPEGQALTFTITRGPKRGEAVLAEDGTFTYTPKKNKVGVDSFTYTATDPAGKVSREATVTITILKPTEAAQYTDTIGRDCRFAAEWMRNTGIFVGESVGDSTCFSPEKTVNRGEFVAMLVKALEIPTEEDVTFTGYEEEIPQWLQPYLAAAVRSGLTAGLPEQEVFDAGKAITEAEAAVMLQNALDLSVPAGAGEMAEGSWADAALEALRQAGINLDAQEVMTREAAAQTLYAASKLMGQ